MNDIHVMQTEVVENVYVIEKSDINVQMLNAYL